MKRAIGASLAGLALLGALLSVAPAFAAEDPYVERAAGAKGEAALRMDVVFGQAGGADRLRERLNASPPPSQAFAAEAWPLVCEDDYHEGRYALAASDCARAAEVGSDAHVLEIVDLLIREPPVQAEGSARAALTAGSHIEVRSGEYLGFAIADTGAQISVMMQSVAAKAHVRLLGVTRSVDTTTTTVAGQIGIIPEVHIGKAVLRNLPVLVLADAQLTLANGAVRLPFIISLYGLAQFGKMAWLDHGRWLALGEAAPEDFKDAVPMIWHPLGLGVPLDGVSGRRAAHLDSGANISYLLEAGLQLIPADERVLMGVGHRRIGGVGGVVEEDIERLPRASLFLAGHPLTFSDVDVAMDADTGEVARLGEDVLGRYAAVVLDFKAMQFSLSP